MKREPGPFDQCFGCFACGYFSVAGCPVQPRPWLYQHQMTGKRIRDPSSTVRYNLLKLRFSLPVRVASTRYEEPRVFAGARQGHGARPAHGDMCWRRVSVIGHAWRALRRNYDCSILLPQNVPLQLLAEVVSLSKQGRCSVFTSSPSAHAWTSSRLRWTVDDYYRAGCLKLWCMLSENRLQQKIFSLHAN